MAHKVTIGEATTAEFVFFLTYLIQLYQPLDSLGTMYKQITQRLNDAEKLLDLLFQQKEVQDKPDATTLKVSNGEVEFGPSQVS